MVIIISMLGFPFLDDWLKDASTHPRSEERPIVTLSYAQSLDGSIALHRGAPLALSGPESMRLTHYLRANHDAILAGIGTIESDDPQLTVRLVEGESPLPVILDSQLRISPSARVFQHPKRPVIACLEASAKSDKALILSRAGAVILPLPEDGRGYISLPILLSSLKPLGIDTLMVEGGATVITAFLQQKLVDRLVVTITPLFSGGLHAVTGELGETLEALPHIKNIRVERCGDDVIILGGI